MAQTLIGRIECCVYNLKDKYLVSCPEEEYFKKLNAGSMSTLDYLTLNQSISERSKSHSKWAMQPEPVDGIECITTVLSPIRQDSLTFRWFSAEQTFTYYQLDGGRLQPTTANELTLTGLTMGQHQLALLSEDQEQKVIRKFNVYRSPLSEREPNDSMLEADVLPFGWQVYGNLTSREIDIYRLEVVESGLIDVHWSCSNSYIAIDV